MKYIVNFSNGESTSFSIHEIGGKFVCEILTGRIIANQNSKGNSPLSDFSFETINITEESLDLVLKKTNEEIQKQIIPTLTYTIKLVDN